MFGFAVNGRLHYDSDVDILVDFDDAGVGAVLDFVERIAPRLELIADVQPKSWCKNDFIARIAPGCVGVIVNDARWFEVDLDIRAAVDHFEKSIVLHREGGFDDPGIDGYRAEMALMHALQSAHTSLELGLLRILEILGEERPVGENSRADLIRRVAATFPGRRPPDLAIKPRRRRERDLPIPTSGHAQLRQLRSAAKLPNDRSRQGARGGLAAEILEFKTTIDPPADENRGDGEAM